MKLLAVKVKRLTLTAEIPKYAHVGDSGMDLVADKPEIIPKNGRATISTGIALQIPEGYEGQVRSRSGLARKHGVFVLNSPGTIDSTYTGEVGVILCNSSDRAFTVIRGMRVAQLVITPVATAKLVEVNLLDETDRGGGGFGSTGLQ
jgi:dUTP pyrophosphatase